jgi:hypothetical protein
MWKKMISTRQLTFELLLYSCVSVLLKAWSLAMASASLTSPSHQHRQKQPLFLENASIDRTDIVHFLGLA